LASTGNIVGTYVNGTNGVGATFTLSVAQIVLIDGNPLTLGMRVLLKDQGTAAQNGIYTVTRLGTASVSAIFTRATDFNTSSTITLGTKVYVTQGDTNAYSHWTLTSFAGTVGTNAITFSGQVWTGGVIPVSKGGTGLGSLTSNALLLGNGTSTVQTISPVAAGSVLVSNGTGSAPNWSTTPTLSSMVVTGITTANKYAIASPKTGQIVYTSDTNYLSYYNGTLWLNLGMDELISNQIIGTGSPWAGFNSLGGSIGLLFYNTNNDGFFSVQLSGVPSLSNYITLDFGIQKRGKYKLKTQFLGSQDRSIVNITEMTTAAVLVNSYDTYRNASNNVVLNTEFDFIFNCNAGTPSNNTANLKIKYRIAGKNSSSTSWHMLINNAVELRQTG
jgi:hypothetical protein